MAVLAKTRTFPKCQLQHARHFVEQRDHVSLYCMQSALPGHSAYNLKRQMVSLSHGFSSLILSFDQCSIWMIMTKSLTLSWKKSNFQKAVKVLAENWGNTVTYSYVIIALFVKKGWLDITSFLGNWYADCVQLSLYCLCENKI